MDSDDDGVAGSSDIEALDMEEEPEEPEQPPGVRGGVVSWLQVPYLNLLVIQV